MCPLTALTGPRGKKEPQLDKNGGTEGKKDDRVREQGRRREQGTQACVPCFPCFQRISIQSP